MVYQQKLLKSILTPQPNYCTYYLVEFGRVKKISVDWKEVHLMKVSKTEPIEKVTSVEE